jgi:hypothetical protein
MSVTWFIACWPSSVQQVASRPGISGRVDMNRLGKGLGKITNR